METPYVNKISKIGIKKRIHSINVDIYFLFNKKACV